MDPRELADILAATESESGRLEVLNANADLADEKLAYALKEICYASWNHEPAKARGAAEAIESLATAAGTPEISAVAHWVRGIADLTRGELEPAVGSLQSSSRCFRELGKPHRAAEATVAMLIPLALLGRYEEAVAAGTEALKAFEESGDDLAAGKIEMNLSNIASRRGEHRSAESYGISARNRFIRAGEAEWQTLAENDLANTYAELNDFRKAEEFYGAALESARKAGMAVTEAEIEASIGNLATFCGRYDEALRNLEVSRRRFDELDMPHQSAIADLEIADIYQTLNLVDEALDIYERVSETLQNLGLQGEEARSRTNLGRLHLSANRFGDARPQLERAAQLYENEGNPLGAARVRLIEAGLEIKAGSAEAALGLLDESDRLTSDRENVRLALESSYLRGEALRKVGRTDEAKTVLSETRLAARKAESPQIALLALNALGLVERDRGDPASAEREFLDSIDVIESMRDPIAAEEFRMAYLADKLEPYDNLVDLYLSSQRYPDAFAMLERARSRTLAESVRGSAAAGGSDPELEEEISSLREELNWYYTRLDRAEEADQEMVLEEVRNRERSLADLTRRMESLSESGISGEDVTGTRGLSVEALGEILGPGRALIEYVERNGGYSALVVTSEGVAFSDLEAGVDEVFASLQGLRFQFGALRYGPSALSAHYDELKHRADSHLADLHDLLLSPVDDLIGERDLVIVPCGQLNYVPFQALRDGEGYQAEKREVVTAPGAEVWAALMQRKTEPLSSALLIGYADENIPNVEDEIWQIGELFSDKSVLVGREATFKSFSSLVPDCTVVHIACHGRFRPDSPMFSSLHLADGYITVRDICSRRMNAALVTLSACETGLNRVYPGNEIIGLARGFLTAGAATIVLSLWTVNDESTARLMRGMYEHLQQGRTASESLNLAQRKMISEGSHPYFWAPFGIIGRQ